MEGPLNDAVITPEPAPGWPFCQMATAISRYLFLKIKIKIKIKWENPS